MSNIVVRRATEADLGEIGAINTGVFLGDRDKPHSALEWVQCWFRAFPLYQYFVAEVDGVVAGYAGWQVHGGFNRAEPVIELDQFGLHKNYQSQGLGSHFMRECMRDLMEWMQSKNNRIESHVTFVVWGYTFNFHAMGAYAKQFGDGVCGFRIQFGSRAENMLRLRMPIIMRPRMIKAIIFDLDMCIFDTRSLGERILEPVLEPLHASSVPAEVKQEVDRVLWTTSLEDTVQLFSIPEDVASAMRRAHQQLVVPDTIRTFGDEDCIVSMPVYRALVTSGYRAWQKGKLDRLGISGLFNEVIIDTIDDPALRKGKKKIFEDLMARHGWSPREVIVVGDNPYSELKAGKELGMHTVQILRPTVRKEEGFDHYIESLKELAPLLTTEP